MQLLTADGGHLDVRAAGNFLESSPIAGPSIAFVPAADGSEIRRDYEQVYLTNPWLFATFNMLANGAARMPLKVYRYVDDTGKRERVRPRGQALPDPKERRVKSFANAANRPGGGVSFASLMRGTMINRKTWGPALWIVHRDRYGDYVRFQRVPYRYLARDKVAGVTRYWDVRSPEQKYLQDDVIQFGRGSDCYELDSPSPLAALQTTVALYDAVWRSLISYFKHGADPSGHYKIQPGTGTQARKAIAEAIRLQHAGPDNRGKILISSAEWQSHGTTPDHNRVVELGKASREEIVAVYNMPPPLVGILDRAIMANVRELRSHYARDVVGPDMVLFEGDFDAQLIAADELLADDVFVEFEMANVMRPDPEARAATYRNRRLVESVNEIRDTENLPRIEHPDADVPWMPRNELPLGEEDPAADGGGSNGRLFEPAQGGDDEADT